MLYWTCIVNAATEQKVRKVMGILSEKLEEKIEIKELEKYHKGESLYKVLFETNIKSSDAKEAVFELLLLTMEMSNNRSVVGPLRNEDNWHFEIIMPQTNVPGLTWVSVNMLN